MPNDAEGAHGSSDPASGSSRPVPDPTSLTTEQLLRAISAERDYTNGQLEVLRERLSGIDKATELRLGAIEHIPEQINEKVGRLEAVMEEKFSSIANQFKERDTRSERESRDNKLAVDAAFAAQEKQAAAQNKSNAEAINKSELAVNETISKLGELFKSTFDAQADKISALERRSERFESIRTGGKEAYAALYVLGGFVIAAVMAVLAVVGTKK